MHFSPINWFRGGDPVTTIITVKNLRHVYPDGTQVELLGEEPFKVSRGEKVAIIGANGAGKTTLLSTLTGLIKPTRGEVQVAGLSPYKDFHQLRRKLGVVLQNAEEQIIGPRVYDDIAFTLRQDRLSPEDVRTEVLQVASMLGIKDELQKIPHYLSGGEKQKVALAGALIHKPDILILDEPLDNLDAHAKQEVEAVLDGLCEGQGVTILLTTHDLNWSARWADTVLVLGRDLPLQHGPPEDILTDWGTLKAVGLEPPVLVSLFKRLKDKGLAEETPVTLDEAEALLEAKIHRRDT